MTVCTSGGRAVLIGPLAASVARSIEQTCRLLDYEPYAYCVMPDHVHVLLSPASSETGLATWLRRFKSYTTRLDQRSAAEARLWQRSARDRVLRPKEPLTTVAAYLARNPERKGLVERWTDWPYTRVFVVPT